MEENTNKEEIQAEIEHKIKYMSEKLNMPIENIIKELDNQGYDPSITKDIIEKLKESGAEFNNKEQEERKAKIQNEIYIGAAMLLIGLIVMTVNGFSNDKTLVYNIFTGVAPSLYGTWALIDGLIKKRKYNQQKQQDNGRKDK